MVFNILNDILNINFNKLLDDTLINRLAESIFCENEIHLNNKYGSITDVSVYDYVKCIANNKLAHPNIIQVLLASLYRTNAQESDLVKLLCISIESENVEIYYSGLWSFMKMMNYLSWNDELVQLIWLKYLMNSNVIYESLFNEIISYLFIKSLNSAQTFHFRIINQILDQSINNLLLLKLLNRDDCHGILLKTISQLDFKVLENNCHLFYCFAILTNNEQSISLYKSLNIKKRNSILTISLLNTNFDRLKELYSQSKFVKYIWSEIMNKICARNQDFVNPLRKISLIPCEVITSDVFKTLLELELYEIIEKLEIKNHLFKDVIKFLMDKNMLEYPQLFKKLFVTIYNELSPEDFNSVEVTSIHNKICRELPNLTVESQGFDLLGNLLNKIITSKMFRDVDVVNMTENIFKELINFIEKDLVNYLASEILETELHENHLAVAVSLVEIYWKTQRSICSNGQLETVQSIISHVSTSEINDNFYLENCLYLGLYISYYYPDSEKLQEIMIEFIDKCLAEDVPLDIQKYYEFLTNSNQVVSEKLADSLLEFRFIYPGDNNQVLPCLKSSYTDIDLAAIRFNTAYCSQCKENRDELINDVLLSTNILECYDD